MPTISISGATDLGPDIQISRNLAEVLMEALFVAGRPKAQKAENADSLNAGGGAIG